MCKLCLQERKQRRDDATVEKLKIKIKSVAYSSQGSHTGQLDF